MRLFHYLRKFYQYPTSFKWLFLKAAWYSMWVEVDIKRNKSVKHNVLKENITESDLATLRLQTSKIQQIRWVTKVMRILEKRAPWKPMCLNRAIVAKRLLKAEGIETTMHVGFKGRASQEEDFAGHAWLTIGNFFITGLIPDLPAYKELKPIKSLKDQP